MARLSRIVRYPVKGLRGVESNREALSPGRGLRGDRLLAIENGVVAPEQPGGWNPRESYFHLARHEAIARVELALHGAEPDDGDAAAAELELGYGGRSIRLALDPAGFERDRARADDFLAGALRSAGLGASSSALTEGGGAPATPAFPEPRLVRAQRGLWDWPDAHLSIINLDTVEALSDAAGQPVDHRRFRGNLYVSGLGPWGELALLGRRVRIGTAVLDIVQPTDRCRATTIGPDSAVSDLNVPGLLASGFGHLFCGVYARVVRAGDVTCGDSLEPLGETLAPLPDALPEWPRAAELLAIEAESPAVTSFWFADPLGIVDGALPGQHVRMHLPGAAAPGWRCYTLSAVEPGRFRISVKRHGRVSGELHALASAGDRIGITGPFGEVTLDPVRDSDLLLISAGVGITPTAAMLRALRSEETGKAPADGAGRGIRVLHVAREAADLALWPEVREAVAAVPGARAELFLTREPDAASVRALGARSGRPGAEALRHALDGLDPARLDAFLCGPPPFVDAVRGALLELGVPGPQIRNEVFFSPAAARQAPLRAPSTAGPHPVSFGAELVSWTPGRGTLLDLAEAAGRGWVSGCRSGACGTCARELDFGEVEYLCEPAVAVPEGQVLSCCTVPTGAVGFAD
ncbi:MOSC domain-containing protein [Leucobacter massiliensis]|uniref:Sulfurase n=1 Tax=Leucobacter massiliensis TaxID=1686285 RepID=A0A2S9QNY3_9MICO|nr:MOSC domain-containing protein [Leucobacter massiliensis]PRI11297.1 hypothetical protein B4915_10680 [Leucobacter massiliensis]